MKKVHCKKCGYIEKIPDICTAYDCLGCGVRTKLETTESPTPLGQTELRCSIARFGEIKNELGDCDFMRAFLNTYTVDAVLWMMAEIERLHKTEQ